MVSMGMRAAWAEPWLRRGRGVLALGVLAFAVAGCAGVQHRLAIALPFTHPASEKTQQAISRLLENPAYANSAIYAFYAARDDRPVWSGSAAARRRAAEVRSVLADADREGLPAGAYPSVPERAVKAGLPAAADDLELTRSLLTYVHDIRLGRVLPSAVYSDLKLPPRSFDPASALRRALEHHDLGDFLRELPPPQPQYRALVSALGRYRQIAVDGGWKRTGLHPSRAQLAARLALEDPTFAAVRDPTAQAVQAALRRFQARHGLDPDGALGRKTQAALNVPVQVRIGQIRANLERWRWLPRDFPSRYVMVNVPAQSVELIDHGKAQLVSKAVVGRKQTDDTTPILVTQANAVIANPPWDIPDDIAAQGLVPHLRRDPHYLQARHMVLVGAPPDVHIDWAKIKGDDLPYQIRQLPGPYNVLGNVMLNTPNDFNVYLHGTSDQALFELKNRERSHGCVRVQKITQLADLALQGSVPHPDVSLSTAIATGKTQRLTLAHPLPVYMLYWTAEAQSDGSVAFFPDRYDRDPPLLAALRRPDAGPPHWPVPPKPAPAKAALAGA